MEIEEAIIKILKKHPKGLGFNELYREVCKVKQCARETFNRKLKGLVQEGIVGNLPILIEVQPKSGEVKKLKGFARIKEAGLIQTFKGRYYLVDESVRLSFDGLYIYTFVYKLDDATRFAWKIINSKKWFNLNKGLKALYCHYFKRLEKAPFIFLEYVYQTALTYEGEEISMLLLKLAFDVYRGNYFSKWQTKLKKIRKKLREEFPKSFKEEEKLKEKNLSFYDELKNKQFTYKLKYKQFTSEEKMQELLYDVAKLNIKLGKLFIKLKNLRKKQLNKNSLLDNL
jgi:hypothetical protein